VVACVRQIPFKAIRLLSNTATTSRSPPRASTYRAVCLRMATLLKKGGVSSRQPCQRPCSPDPPRPAVVGRALMLPTRWDCRLVGSTPRFGQ
jgi:hypothetical protein